MFTNAITLIKGAGRSLSSPVTGVQNPEPKITYLIKIIL